MRNFIKKYIDTYRDIVVIAVMALWLIGNIIEYKLLDFCFFVDIFWITVMIILIIVDRKNDSFRKWLNTSLYKK